MFEHAKRTALRVYMRSATARPGADQLAAQREGCRAFTISALRERHGLTPSWEERHEYQDEGKAGLGADDRAGLAQLLADVQPGDVIVMRDASRMSRSWEESSAILRTMWARGARVFFYEAGGIEASAGAFEGLSRVLGTQERAS